jgi:hypothetical protein
VPWFNRTWDVLSIGTRVALVALSMYITAPFLAQLMFDDDIERALAAERLELRGNTRQSQLEPLDQRAAALQTQLDQRRAALDAEVAGAGASGKYGDGVAARQIRATIATLEAERAQVTSERTRLASEFDALTDEEMAVRYNVALPGDSFQERARLLGEIKNDSYRLTERAVQAFLAFLFVAMVLLKLFEPRSVKVYFSERLQGLHRQYAGGLFDPQLDPAERSIGTAPMTPLRFEDWCLNSYPAIRARSVEVLKAGERTQFFGNSASELSALTAQLVAEESQLLAELAQLESRRQQVLVEHTAAVRAHDTASGQLSEVKSQRATLEGGLKRPASGQTLTAIVGTLSELDTAATTAVTECASAQDRMDALAPMLVELNKRCADLSARVERHGMTRARAEAELADARLRHMNEVSRAIAARWGDVPPPERAPLATPKDEPAQIM